MTLIGLLSADLLIVLLLTNHVGEYKKSIEVDST